VAGVAIVHPAWSQALAAQHQKELRDRADAFRIARGGAERRSRKWGKIRSVRKPISKKGAPATSQLNLRKALASFEEIYSPRIVGRVNDYDVKVAHVNGEHLWHVHERTDELFLVLSGSFDISLRDPEEGERTIELGEGDVYVVPKGVEHKPSSTGGSILMFEPSGTETTGDRHDGPIPDYVDSTAGHHLEQSGPR